MVKRINSARNGRIQRLLEGLLHGFRDSHLLLLQAELPLVIVAAIHDIDVDAFNICTHDDQDDEFIEYLGDFGT